MGIKRSPGCTCCEPETCDVVEYQDLEYDLTAGEVYELPGSINDFNKIELTHLIPRGYFNHIDDWFDLGLYYYDESLDEDVLIQNLRYQLMSLGQSYSYEAGLPAFNYPSLDKYRGLGVRVNDEWHIVQPTMYTDCVATNDVCIIGTSSGTYERGMTRVFTALSEYNYKYIPEDSDFYYFSTAYRWAKIEKPCEMLTHYGFEKSRYVLFGDEDSVSSKFFRYNKSSQDTDLYLTSNDSGNQNQVTTNHTVSSGSITSSFTRDIPESLPSNTYYLNLFNPDSDPSNVSSASVVTHSTDSVTGSGHFDVEADFAFVEEGGSVDLRVFRTGGNTEAVDVEIFYNGSRSTLSFASGENYKTITVNSVSHSGLRSEINRHTDSVPAIPLDEYSLNHIHVRKHVWEVGTDSDEWLAKSHDEAQDRYFWWRNAIPFEKDESIWRGDVKVKVTSSKDVTLGWYGVSKISNDATCDLEDENERLCPVHKLCDVISDFSHYPIDFADSTGNMYLPTEEKHVFINGCETRHVFRGVGLDFSEPEYVYRKNGRSDMYYRDLQEDPVYQIFDYTPPTNTTPSSRTATCDGQTVTYTTYNDYSNLPGGFVAFNTHIVQDLVCSGYGGASIVSRYLPRLYGPWDVANMSPTSSVTEYTVLMNKTTYCDDWSFLYGDTSYSYTDDGSSPFSEVVVKTVISTRYGSLDDPPEDTSDTSHEIIVKYIPDDEIDTSIFWGAAFQWNGSSYDMIGQDRIYGRPVPSSSSDLLTNQSVIDAITEPFWFYSQGGYYYIKPNSGSALTVEGPFTTPEDTTNSVSVTYEGKNRVDLEIFYGGAYSNGVEANGLIWDFGDYEDMLPYVREWNPYNLDYVTVVDSGGTFTASRVPLPEAKQILDPIVDCSLEKCEDGPLQSDVIIMHPDTNQYGYWEPPYIADGACSCNWSLANTLEDRNEEFNVPEDANQDCEWLDCVPPLNPSSFNFDYCLQPSDSKAFDSYVLVEDTFTYNLANICDCPDNTVAETEDIQYLDFNGESEWNGEMFLTESSLGSTYGMSYAIPMTSFMPPIKRHGFRPRGSFFYEGIGNGHYDLDGSLRAEYVTYQDVCDYTDFPTVTLSESDLTKPPDDTKSDNFWRYEDRELRFVSGYSIGSTSTVDWYDPDYQSRVFGDVCWKMKEVDEVTMDYVDVHPRYTAPQIKSFSTLWPK